MPKKKKAPPPPPPASRRIDETRPEVSPLTGDDFDDLRAYVESAVECLRAGLEAVKNPPPGEPIDTLEIETVIEALAKRIPDEIKRLAKLADEQKTAADELVSYADDLVGEVADAIERADEADAIREAIERSAAVPARAWTEAAIRAQAFDYDGAIRALGVRS